MAKSIFDILDDVTTETSVPSQGKGVTIEHTLPRNLFPTSAQFESEDDLLEWSREWGFTHAILQRGIQKFLIEARAAFKSCKKNDVWSPEYGQLNVNELEWSIVKRPNQASNTVAIAHAVLAETISNMQMMIDVAGLTEAKIKEVLNEKFDEETDIIETILKALKF